MNNIKSFMLIFILFLFISTNLYSAEITKEYDAVKQVTVYKSTLTTFNDGSFYIIAVRDIVSTLYSIGVLINYQGDYCRFYGTAYDNAGNKLDLIKAGRDIKCTSGGCTLSESVCIFFSKKEFTKINRSGITLKIYGRDGANVICTVPGSSINEMIVEVEKRKVVRSL